MKSKEEIIKQFKDDPFTGSINQSHAERCFEIADEYTRQQAIAFAEWAFKDDINPFIWEQGKQRFIQACGNSTSWSTEQLYNLYLESKKQKV